MDVVKSKASAKSTYKNKIAIGIGLLIILAIAFFGGNRVTLSKQNLILATVKQGDLTISVDGYGILASNKRQLLTAATPATVKEIRLKPGAKVSNDSIIAMLENPQLSFQVENAKHELAQLDANLRQLQLNQQRELLTEQAVLAGLNAQHQSIKLKRQAQQVLVKKGIISDITFKQTQLDEKQLAERIRILTERLSQLSLVHQEAINIQQQRIKQQNARMAIVEKQQQQLTVTAGFDGILQRLPIDVGQRLMAGEEIALIASSKDLFAEIRVAQSQAAKIALGQQVIIDTREATIVGTVSRIDPIVSDNSVQVDIALPENLPGNTRLAQNVDAKIITKSLHNVHYIERPANIATNSEQVLYQVNQSLDRAQRKTIKFGEQNNHYVEVQSPVQAGEQFIISNLSNYQAEQLVLN